MELLRAVADVAGGRIAWTAGGWGLMQWSKVSATVLYGVLVYAMEALRRTALCGRCGRTANLLFGNVCGECDGAMESILLAPLWTPVLKLRFVLEAGRAIWRERQTGRELPWVDDPNWSEDEDDDNGDSEDSDRDQ